MKYLWMNMLVIILFSEFLWSSNKEKQLLSMVEVEGRALSEEKLRALFTNFDKEPLVGEVVSKAIAYAQVAPQEVSSWKKRVRNAPWLPKLRAGVDRRWDLGSSTREQIGQADAVFVRDRRDLGTDVDLEWELPKLIFNNDELNIARESVRLSELREKIIDEVVDLYFERRRKQIEIKLQSPQEVSLQIQNALELEKLTAQISALTGGWFHEMVSST